MPTVTVIFRGNTPSKKNSKQMARTKDGRYFPVSSKIQKQWEQAIKRSFKNDPCEMMRPSSIEITIFPKTRRRSDLTNKAESVMDMLVSLGIIEDDNWFICGDIRLLFGGVDKADPRAVIRISTGR